MAAPSIAGLPIGERTRSLEALSLCSNSRYGAISRTELPFLLGLFLVVGSITSLPYVAGHLYSYPGTVFTGVIEHSADTNNYLAYAHQAAMGSWLFRNPMTGEPHHAVFFNLEWLMIGKTSSCMHLSLAGAMNVIRLVFLTGMTLGVFWLASFVVQSAFLRRAAVVAVLTGGGFGWLAGVHLLHVPMDSSYFLDLTAALQFPFYWALKLPHFLVSETFVVFGLCFFLRGEHTRHAGNYAAAGLLFMAAGSCRPYDMLFLMMVTGVYAILCAWRERVLDGTLFRRAIPALMCTPLLGYYYWIFKIHPVFRWWSLPGLPPPTPALLALSYGLTLILLVISIWNLWGKRLEDAAVLTGCCLVTAVSLVYTYRLFHFSFQFATNIIVPAVLLSAIALERTGWRNPGKSLRIWACALLAVNSLTSLALAGQALVLVKQGDFRMDAQLLEAYQWLDRHSGPEDLIVADFSNSNFLPQYISGKVFCGYSNTVEYASKRRAQSAFFDPVTGAEVREKLLQQNAVSFVFTSLAEAQVLARSSGGWSGREIFRNGAAVIYAVNRVSASTNAAGGYVTSHTAR